ncbi:hypothetical protein HNY73_022064 [Argiope bruennichi]|uniref:Uncharacterized protein n=1 Tax=Argiope bruennichi TaxID=94029 RepID=A0A8T0E0R4_ARGBR|nr:hypothetical protein HNY73_022064 [Argiope bruennichi]
MNLYKLSKKDISEDNILNSTLTMERLTTSSEEINSADVKYIAQILENVADVPAIESEILEPVVNTVDTVIKAISTLDKRYSLTRASTSRRADWIRCHQFHQTEQQRRAPYRDRASSVEATWIYWPPSPTTSPAGVGICRVHKTAPKTVQKRR